MGVYINVTFIDYIWDGTKIASEKIKPLLYGRRFIYAGTLSAAYTI
jgi:hypothetical protein